MRKNTKNPLLASKIIILKSLESQPITTLQQKQINTFLLLSIELNRTLIYKIPNFSKLKTIFKNIISFIIMKSPDKLFVIHQKQSLI